MHLKKLYQVFSMRRGGQHVFIDWLLEQSQGSVLFLNDLEPEQDIAQRAAVPGEFDKIFRDGKPSYVKPDRFDVVIVNYEDLPLTDSALQLSTSANVVVDEISNILVLRDPLNLFASRYFFWSRMPLDAKRWLWDDTQLWLNHAHYFLSHQSLSSDSFIPVNFNEWITDRDIRQLLAEKLGLDYHDQALQRIAHVGSQFETGKDKDHSGRVNARWQYAAQIPEFQKIFNNALLDISRQIFNNETTIVKMQSTELSMMATAETIFSKFKSGVTKEAQYEAIRLCHNKPSVNNLNLLAGIQAQLGNYDDVVACCHKMLAIDPDNISTKYNLALALQELSRLDEAKLLYEDIISANGNNPGVFINLANIYIKTRDFVQAKKLLDTLQAAGIASNEFYNTQALMFMEEGKHELAIEPLEKAITLNNQVVATHLNLSRCLVNTGEYIRAVKMMQELMASRHLDDHSTQIALAYVYRHALDYDNALKVLLLEQGKGHQSLDLCMELGHVYRELDEYEKAIQAYNSALSINHKIEQTLNNIGAVYMLKRNYSAAEQYFQQSIAINSSYSEAHWNLAFVSLLQGKLKQGWREYEWRFDVGVTTRSDFSNCSEWQGESLTGKKILLYVEQGYGDAIQFIRYSKALHDAGAEVSVLCDNVISGILACANGVDNVTSSFEPGVDYFAPLMSVPHLLQRDGIPYNTPYINPDYSSIPDELVAMLSNKDESKVHIGITWCGNPAFPNNRRRSFGVEHFVRLAGRKDVILYSLQKGIASDNLNKYSDIENIINMDSIINNFTDTAFIMSKLDLVITVDTSVAHLSGATGCNTWVLIPYSADWRWHDDTTSSQWYQSTELFRQKKPGNWDNVFDLVSDAIDVLQTGAK